ncbi:iron export ABC transporter permease subunit FetB [Syntrophotalea acetylenivorans]|uniref:Iron export ABC transporter permease subunit FetB n=1 Tax=Syntrophotalea acetylenivorans TaxID=1842532 RepID=A0A1L3GKM7_9BACT|nr:iron export ABC transporter permease subunit FetB [Syntrophotalea acetylenivorans]APG26503.1 iron export ABC transporter permease subunit FetB [Syntrophotalea acetylenivorans]
MSAQEIIALAPHDLLWAYGALLLAAALAWQHRIGQSRDLLWGSLRMVLQLLAVGYALRWIFAARHPLPTVLMLLVMGGFSLQIMAGRLRHKLPGFYRIVSLSLFAGCGGVTLYFCLLVVAPSPWYEPRYLIPLAGMIIGNSINGACLAVERLAAEMKERQAEIEAALCLGASPRMACQEPLRNAFRAALLPMVNTMAAMGVVSLPGMMTGQILSGTDPLIAVKYQIAIMCAIVGSVALTSALLLLQGYRTYFTDAHQLRS